MNFAQLNLDHALFLIFQSLVRNVLYFLFSANDDQGDAVDSLSHQNVSLGESYTLGCIFKVGDDVRQVLLFFDYEEKVFL